MIDVIPQKVQPEMIYMYYDDVLNLKPIMLFY